MHQHRDESNVYHLELGCREQPKHGVKDWIELPLGGIFFPEFMRSDRYFDVLTLSSGMRAWRAPILFCQEGRFQIVSRKRMVIRNCHIDAPSSIVS